MLLMVSRCRPIGGIWNGSKHSGEGGRGDPGRVVEVSDVTPRDAGRQTPHTWDPGTNNYWYQLAAKFCATDNIGLTLFYQSFIIFPHIPLALVIFQIPKMLNNT